MQILSRLEQRVHSRLLNAIICCSSSNCFPAEEAWINTSFTFLLPKNDGAEEVLGWRETFALGDSFAVEESKRCFDPFVSHGLTGIPINDDEERITMKWYLCVWTNNNTIPWYYRKHMRIAWSASSLFSPPKVEHPIHGSDLSYLTSTFPQTCSVRVRISISQRRERESSQWMPQWCDQKYLTMRK